MSSYLEYRRNLKLGKAPPADGNKASGGNRLKNEGKGTKPPEARKTVKIKPAGVPGKTRSKIKKRSKKQKAVMKDLKLAYGPYLEKNPVCVIQSPVCTHKVTCVNHKAGRGPNQVLDQKTWEPSCDPCNLYIESHDAWARENGHKTTRLGKARNNLEIR